ncbi:unnamed protein product, partial [Medioppia subpectinata]
MGINSGAFLIPNYICVVFVGIPMFLLEVSLGQYLNTGGIAIWNLVPIFKGIGFASMTMIGLCNIYYIILIAWTLFYLVSSFTAELPWSSCNNTWNTDNCMSFIDNTSHAEAVSPVKEYWEYVLPDTTTRRRLPLPLIVILTNLSEALSPMEKRGTGIGGGAFLIPNYICVVFVGIPMFLLEVSLGQYLNTGGIAIWNLVPIFKGIGFASMTMIGLCNIYYIILIAWTLFYLVSSFTAELPWS